MSTEDRPFRVFTRSSKLPANVFKIHVNCWTFAAICYNGAGRLLKVCWKFAGRLLDRVNTLLLDLLSFLTFRALQKKNTHSLYCRKLYCSITDDFWTVCVRCTFVANTFLAFL